jgi:TusA-related sulfurtransferase
MRCPYAGIECSHCVEEEKKAYGEHLKVLLTDKEVQSMIKRFGKDGFQDLVDRCNNYIMQIGDKEANKKYKSHYATMLNWARKDNGTKFVPKHTSLQSKMESWAKEGRLLNKDSMGEDLFKFTYSYLIEHKLRWPEYCHRVAYHIPIDEPIQEVDFKSKAAGE